MHAISAGRAQEVRTLLERHRENHGFAYMLTLTLPHDQGDELRAMRRHVARAWQFVQGGAPWKRWKRKIAFFGTVRALEVTHGAAGWHPHLHVLLLTRGKLPAQLQAEFVEFVLARWRRAIVKPNKVNGKVYRAPTAEHGVTLTESHRDDYIAKLGLADEVVRGIDKDARGGGRTPLRILYDVATKAGTLAEWRRSIALWMEYSEEMRGARQLTWSKGLQAAYDIPEQTELELAIAEEKEEKQELYAFASDDWDKILARNVGLQLRILKAAETLHADLVEEAIVRLLDQARGLPAVPF